MLDKVDEEARRAVAARDDAERREEFGDLLMVLVNLARKLGVDSEAALRQRKRQVRRRALRTSSASPTSTKVDLNASVVRTSSTSCGRKPR